MIDLTVEKLPSCDELCPHQSVDNKAWFRFYENWTIKQLLEKHLDSPRVSRFKARISELLVEPPEITLWKK